MTDENLRETVDVLRERVSRLEEIVEQDDQNHSGEKKTRERTRYDRYDSRVVEGIEPNSVVTFKRLRTLYNAAGVRNKNKIKQRVEALTSGEEFVNTDGVGRWRYTGGKQ